MIQRKMYLRNRILLYFILVTVVTVKRASPSSSDNITRVEPTPSSDVSIPTSSSGEAPSTTTSSEASTGPAVINTTITEVQTNSTVQSTSNIASSTPLATGGSIPTSSSVGTSSTTTSSVAPTGSTVISTRTTKVMTPSTVNSTIASSTPSTTNGSIPKSSSGRAPSTTSSVTPTGSMPTSSSVRAPSTTTSPVAPTGSNLKSSSSSVRTPSTTTSPVAPTVMTSMPFTPNPPDAGDTLVSAIAGAGGAIIVMIVIFIVIMSLVLIYVVMKTPKKNKDDSKWITGKELVDLNQLENEEENGRMGAGGTGGEAKVESNMEGENRSEDKDAQEDETTKVEMNGEGEKSQVEETTDKVGGSSSQPKETNSDEQPKTDTLVTANQSGKDEGVPSNIGDPTTLTTGNETSTPAKATTFVGGPSQTDGETENKKLEDLLSGDSSKQEKKTDASEDGSKESPVTSPTPVVASDQPKDITPNVSGTPEGDKVTSAKDDEAATESKT